MEIKDMIFHRLFSKTLYKNLKLPLGEMTFSKDFVTDANGDPYPLAEKSADCDETVAHNRYILTRGSARRVMGAFFPYATYEVTFRTEGGGCGFHFSIPEGDASVLWRAGTVHFREADRWETVPCPAVEDALTLLVSCRPKAFDVYVLRNGSAEFVHTFGTQTFACSHRQKSFQRGFVSLAAEAPVTVEAASFYIDCGVSQADMRPICYENGEVMMENGLVYITISIRIQAEGFQGIFAWVPGTSDFRFTGALFFDSGDGKWCGYLASSLCYHRKWGKWLVWVSSFAHQHILCHGAFRGDPRFGVNVVDVQMMPQADEHSAFTDFVGFRGDEDPDFFYDEQEDCWYMAVCRVDPTQKAYRYLFFRSHDPFTGYTCIGKAYDGSETGGSFVDLDGQRAFVCGNSYDVRSNYRIYTKDGMREAKFDLPDGGFRGWGCVIPVWQGSRKRYYWLTFDRHQGSDYTWSYGNLYGFEAMIE